MPRIRVNREARIAETFRQAPNVTRGAGQVAQAMAGMGRALNNVAEDVGNMLIKARDNDESTQARADYESFRNQLEQDLKAKFAQDPTGYAQEVQKQSDAWLNDRRQKMSTPQGAQSLDSWAKPANSRLVGAAQRHERSRLAGIHQQTLSNFGNDIGKARAEVPRVDEFKQDYAASLSTHEASVGTAFNTKEEALQAHKQTIRKIAFGNLEGLTRMESSNYNTNMSKLRTAKAMLKDKDFTEGMTSEDKARWLDQINRAEKQQKTKRDIVSSSQLNDYFIAKSEGKEVSPEFEESLLSNLKQIQDPVDREKAVSTFSVAKILGQTVESMDIEDYDSLENYEEDLEKKINALDKKGIPFNESIKRQAINQGKAEARRRRNEMAKRGADYVAKVDEEVSSALRQAELTNDPVAWQEYYSASEAAQKARKIPNVKLFREDEKEEYASLVKNAAVSGQYKQIENELKLKFGKHYPKAIAELSSTDKDVKSALLATRYGDASSKTKVFRNMKDKEQIDGAFKALGLSRDKLDKAVKKKLEPFMLSNMAGTNGAERFNFSNEITEQVRQEAMVGMVKGLSPDRAVEEAKVAILDKNYITLGHHNIVVPRTVITKDGSQQSQVDEKIMDRFFDEPFRAEVFEGIEFQKEKIVGRDEYLKHIQNKGKWILSEDQNHFQLMIDEGGVFHQAKQEDGQPVKVHLDDIHENPRYIRKARDFATHIFDFLRGVNVEAAVTGSILEQRGLTFEEGEE